jgi:nucleotide-binding universal stress UspA family protein
MKEILVPCDFSLPALNAFRLAIDLVRRSDGTIHLLNVIELPVFQDPMMLPVLNFEEQFINDLKKNAELQFAKLKKDYANDGVKLVTRIELGRAYPEILNYISQNPIDQVVMGSHGASGFNELFIGSNAQKIVRKSPVPVLVTKGYFKGPVKNIVFPNSLHTEGQDDLVSKVKMLQEFFDAHIHIVWINTPANFTADNITHERLESFATEFSFKNYSTHVFNHPQDEQGILQFAKFIQGDIIAMGTHSRQGFAHIVNGSLAEDVVNHTDKLVWTYSMRNKPVEK